MGKIIETTVNRFDNGISGDPRLGPQTITNFNALTNPRRLIPYPDSEGGAAGPDDEKFQNFCISYNGSNYALYALGVISDASQLAEVKYKFLTTGGATDLDDTAWANTNNNQSSAGAVAFNLFVYYPKTGYIYGARAGTHIWRYDPDGGDAWADSHQALTYSSIFQGLVHSRDDNLYIPYYNSGGYIARNNNGSWNTTALTLPLHYKPVSICEYGNYLAIGCQHIDGVSNSRVFLWDLTASSWSEGVDWGDGQIKVLHEVDGVLIGISDTSGASTRFDARVAFRALDLTRAVKFLELQSDDTTGSVIATHKQLVDNRLYFLMTITLHGATREGVFSIGRSSPSSPFVLIHERKPNNDTAIVAGQGLKGFTVVGDYVFIAYTTTNGAYALSKTDDAEAKTATTSIYESQIFDNGDPSQKKSLLGVSVFTDYLPASAQVVVKYKKDEDTSFTTILTHDTDNAVSASALFNTSGHLPEYQEITFRLESTGGAVITGFSFKSQFIEARAY